MSWLLDFTIVLAAVIALFVVASYTRGWRR